MPTPRRLPDQQSPVFGLPAGLKGELADRHGVIERAGSLLRSGYVREGVAAQIHKTSSAFPVEPSRLSHPDGRLLFTDSTAGPGSVRERRAPTRWRGGYIFAFAVPSTRPPVELPSDADAAMWTGRYRARTLRLARAGETTARRATCYPFSRVTLAGCWRLRERCSRDRSDEEAAHFSKRGLSCYHLVEGKLSKYSLSWGSGTRVSRRSSGTVRRGLACSFIGATPPCQPTLRQKFRFERGADTVRRSNNTDGRAEVGGRTFEADSTSPSGLVPQASAKAWSVPSPNWLGDDAGMTREGGTTTGATTSREVRRHPVGWRERAGRGPRSPGACADPRSPLRPGR
jgi:hypothetical protein